MPWMRQPRTQLRLRQPGGQAWALTASVQRVKSGCWSRRIAANNAVDAATSNATASAATWTVRDALAEPDVRGQVPRPRGGLLVEGPVRPPVRARLLHV